MYAEYLKEREGIETLTSENGFMTYTLTDDAVYIVDVYIRPEARKTGEATKLEAKVIEKAKEAGKSHLMGSVSFGVAGIDASLKMMVRSGYSFLSFDNEKQLMYFVKGI